MGGGVGGLKKAREERKMGGSIIFGSHNKQLAPFSLLEPGRSGGEGRGGGRAESGGDTERRSSDALLWLLSYG